MNPTDIHRAWAPADGAWSPWVKPVLFASLRSEDLPDDKTELPSLPEWFLPQVLSPLEERADAVGPYRDRRKLHDTAIVIDLPAERGASLGVALVPYGFRPIPLYNALPARSTVPIVDVKPILEVLVRGAEHVADASSSAPPAFLLDANRMGRGRTVRPGLFDNRSACRRSDFPTAARFHQAGIRRIVVIADAIQEDLEPIALEWQLAGLELWSKRRWDDDRASPITLRRRWFGHRIWTLARRLAFKQRDDGAYGALIEEPAASAS
jgi:hypothetical protein